MKYLILEIQTDSNGNVTTLLTQKDELNEAQSTYFSILAAAALSTLTHHAAVLMTNEGITLEFRDFARENIDAEEGA